MGGGGRHQCVGRDTWHRSRAAFLPWRGVRPGPLSKCSRKTPCGCVCETPAARPVAAPCPCTAPSPLPLSGSLVGQGAFSATLPHVCVSHSDILPVPTQDLGFLCPGCPGCTPYPQGPAVPPGARPTTEPGTRRPSTCPPALLSLSPASPSPGTGFSSSPKPVTTRPAGLRDVCERSRAGSAPCTPPLSRSPKVKVASAPGTPPPSPSPRVKAGSAPGF